jgi:hypothetical protein
MKDICLCIQAIAVVEIPTGKWPEFVTTMCTQGMQNDSQYFKMAGIYLLGLIQDVLLPQDFSENDLANIWNTMLQNIDPQNLDLTKIIAKSLSRLASASQISF